MTQKTQKPTSVSNFLEKSSGPAAYDLLVTNSAKTATPLPVQLFIDTEKDIEDENKNKDIEVGSSIMDRESEISPPEMPLTPQGNTVNNYISNKPITSNNKNSITAIQRFSESGISASKNETDAINSTGLPLSNGDQHHIAASFTTAALQLKSSRESTIESGTLSGEPSPIQHFFSLPIEAKIRNASVIQNKPDLKEEEEEQETSQLKEHELDYSEETDDNGDGSDGDSNVADDGSGDFGTPIQKKDGDSTSSGNAPSDNSVPQEVMGKMENTIGHDFSNVNIHSNSSKASEVGALAYTQGNDIHFAPGQFDPDTKSGQELIGHELTHVVQQRKGLVKPTIQLKSGLTVNDDPALEKEADEMGRKISNFHNTSRSEGNEKFTQSKFINAEPKSENSSSGNTLNQVGQFKVAQFDKKVTGGYKVSEQGIEVSITATPKKEVKASYAKITYSTPITAKGELKLKGDATDVGASVEEGTDGSLSVKGRLNLHKAQAIQEGTKSLSEAAYNKLSDEGMFDIKSADLELGVDLSEDNQNSSASPMVGIKLTLQNGDEITTSINLFTYSKDEKSGPSLNAAYQFTLPSYIAWQNNIAELSLGGDVKAQVKIEPDYTKLFKHLLKEKGRRLILARMSRLMFGPGALIAGIGVSIFSAWKMIDSIQSIKNAAQKAEDAKSSYVSGFLDELGISKFGKNKKDFDFFLNGCADGNAALANQVTVIQSHAYFAQWNFTRGELFEALREECGKHAGTFFNEIDGRAKATIFPQFVNAYYNKRKSEWTTSEHMAYKDAKYVAYRLGLKESVINREK